MKINYDKTSKEKIFLILYVLVLFSNMFCQFKYYPVILNYIEYAALLIMLGMIAVDIIKSKKINFKLLLIFVICTIVTYFTKDKTLLKYAIIVSAAICADFKNIIKTDFRYRTIFLIAVVVFNQLGLMDSVSVLRYDGTIRYSLGFIHPNTFALNVMIIVLDHIVINYSSSEKINIVHLICYLISILLILKISDTKSCVVCIIMMIIYLLFRKYFNKIYNFKIINFITKYSFLLFTIVSFLVCYYYNDELSLFKSLDSITSSRVSIGNYYLHKYNVALGGQQIIETSKSLSMQNNINHYPLDNGYLYIVLVYGIIITLMYVILFYKLFKYLLKEKEHTLLFVMTVFLLYGFMESNFCNINNNVYMLSFIYVLTKNKNETKLL